MRVLVCGGRDYNDLVQVYRTLGQLVPQPTVIIEGGARGADHLAKLWAEKSKTPLEEYRADWTVPNNAGGVIRNQKMLTEGKPDLVVAFPGGRGTADMVRRARKAGVKVLEVAELDTAS